MLALALLFTFSFPYFLPSGLSLLVQVVGLHSSPSSKSVDRIFNLTLISGGAS
jgi:hypothetical protein